jgi:CspA family cold shock protein
MSAGVTTTEYGTVKFWIFDRGFGFIRPDGASGPDVFVHVRNLERAGLDMLERGDRVEFQRERDGRGWHAQNVRLAPD